MSISVIAEVKGVDHGIGGHGNSVAEATEDFIKAIEREIHEREEMAETLRGLLP